MYIAIIVETIFTADKPNCTWLNLREVAAVAHQATEEEVGTLSDFDMFVVRFLDLEDTIRLGTLCSRLFYMARLYTLSNERSSQKKHPIL